METVYQAATVILATAGIVAIVTALGLLVFGGVHGLWDWPRRP
jgi:hypothetical protein